MGALPCTHLFFGSRRTFFSFSLFFFLVLFRERNYVRESERLFCSIQGFAFVMDGCSSGHSLEEALHPEPTERMVSRSGNRHNFRDIVFHKTRVQRVTDIESACSTLIFPIFFFAFGLRLLEKLQTIISRRVKPVVVSTSLST